MRILIGAITGILIVAVFVLNFSLIMAGVYYLSGQNENIVCLPVVLFSVIAAVALLSFEVWTIGFALTKMSKLRERG